MRDGRGGGGGGGGGCGCGTTTVESTKESTSSTEAEEKEEAQHRQQSPEPLSLSEFSVIAAVSTVIGHFAFPLYAFTLSSHHPNSSNSPISTPKLSRHSSMLINFLTSVSP